MKHGPAQAFQTIIAIQSMVMRKTILDSLKELDAPRVFSLAEMMSHAQEIFPDISQRQTGLFIKQAESFGVLTNIRHGIWLNNYAFPIPTPSEAAHRIRKDAVVSLITVLSDAGILNNFTNDVYSVLPIPEAGRGVKPRLGTVEGHSTNYYFRGIKQSILEAGEESDRLVPFLSYDRATPEAAVVHWLYLAQSHTSTMREPDTQCDIDQLDLERLERLARASKTTDIVLPWVERCQQRTEDDDNHTNWGPGL